MKNRKLFALALILALALALVGCAKTDDAPENTCTLSIDCTEAVDHPELLDAETLEILPEDGMMLDGVEVGFSDGQTAWDAFLSAAQDAKLQYESEGTGESAYLTGIGNLYTGDAGDMSGWVFEVNGASPDVGCGQFTLEDGDEVVFRYVVDFNEYFAALWG